MTHEDYKELLSAHALTALDAADSRALNAHLDSCADCRSELESWNDTAAFLALDAKPLEPSANVRAQIIANVRANDPAEIIATARTRISSSSTNVLPFEPGRIWTPARSFGAIAATVIFVSLIVALVVMWQQNRATQREIARLSTELRQAQAQLDHERAVVALMTSPGAHMAKLAGTKMAPGAHAMLAYDKNGHAMLMANGLPAAPKGMAYQLWYIKDNQKMPGKVFTPDAAGNGILEDEVPSAARNAAVFAITLEPESGVQTPTGSIYLVSAS